ncbi:MAG: type I-C CRISPR-associated protein Cas5c [Treponema sp.]
MENSIEYRLYGKYALFTDPVTKIGGEKSTYLVPTYEALKGITQSIYWKPTIVWVVDSVRVMHKISTEAKDVKPLYYQPKKAEVYYDLSIYTYLRDVEYQVKAHFEWNMQRPDLEKDRNEDKHYQITKRSLEKGGRRDIFFGTRECQGYVEPCVFGSGAGFYDAEDSFSFGFMFHGFDYPDEHSGNMLTARFWHAEMKKGIITFPRPEDCKFRRDIRPMQPEKPAVESVEKTEAER